MAVHKPPNLTDFSHELLCHILQYLPLKKILSISMLCKKLSSAVDMHLRLCKEIDFCEGKIYDCMPSSITDDHMHALFKKCPNLETVYGLHPLEVERRRLRKRTALTVRGIIEALSLCCNLKSIETSDLRLLEAIMQHLPHLDIIGHFQNRDGVFPPHTSQRLKLQPNPRISSLHLIGVEVPELTAMPHLEHLHLQCVRFTKLQPFRAFLAQNLKTFVMKHCMGPSLSLRYLSLIIALSSSPSLTRLELVRVPLPGGLFQRAVEDSYRHNGFVNLKSLVISGCKGVLEADLGHLMIVSSKNLESISIQPSLTRDSLFVSLSFAQCEFPKLKNVHLGFVDKLNSAGEWSNEVLLSLGLAEVPDTPSSLTDSGMKVISQLFPNIKSMSVSNCPHLMAMDQWSPIDGEQAWKELTDLTLQRCHCLQLPSFALFLAFLPKIEVVILNDMFREPPKGCSHVGLSAGTGLGMSSAVVSNQDEHIAVQGPQQDFELQPDEHMDNDDLDRDFMDIENEENPDQHIMVLQQEFFDEENHIAPPPVVQRDDVNVEHRIENVEQNYPEEFNRIMMNEGRDVDYRIFLNEGMRGDVVQRDDVDPERRIENMEHDVPENRIRREINEGYDGDYGMFRNNENGQDDADPDQVEDVDRNVEENRIKREINEGYDVDYEALCGDGNRRNVSGNSQAKRVENFRRSSRHRSRRCSRGKPNRRDSYKEPKRASRSCISSESSDENEIIDVETIDSNQKENIEVEPIVFEPPDEHQMFANSFVESSDSEAETKTMFERGSSRLIKKKSNIYEKECHHSKECRNKCSKGFDPNQPSTSRDGNCLDCTCTDFDADFEYRESSASKEEKVQCRGADTDFKSCQPSTSKHENVLQSKGLNFDTELKIDTEVKIESRASSKRCRRVSLDDTNRTPKRRKSDTDKTPENNSCSENRGEENTADDVKDEQFEGPLTRQRKKTLNVDIKAEPTSPRLTRGSARTTSIQKIHSPPSQNLPNKLETPFCSNVEESKSSESSDKKDDGSKIDPDCSVSIKSENEAVPSKSETPVEREESSRVRKRKKHKHKRCKKSRRCQKASHRNRPLTRSQKKRMSHEDYNIVNQGTQATSADIRRSLRRQRNCSRRRGSDHCRNHHRSHSSISTRQLLQRPKQTKPNVVMHNKSTSTSDPLMEDDAVQTLRLVSETLISLTIISCGISDVVIDHCHSMTHVEVQACRILKMFQLHYCPSLKRMSVSQCPKLTLEAIIPEVISLVATRKLLISFEPCMQMYSPAEWERAIFSKAPLDQGIILFHDFTSSANESTQAAFKEYLLRWMEAVQKLYYTPSFWLAKQKKRKSKTKEAKTRYPYGHYLRRVHGVYTLPTSVDPSGTKWKYQILTNDHVFASALEKVPWDKGFPPPESAEDYNEDDALLSMIETEFSEKNLKMQKKLITFYIPVSESTS